MIISKIESVPAWGDKDLPAADSLLVKVTTDDGLEGWGEAFGFRAVSSAKLAIDELIALSSQNGRVVVPTRPGLGFEPDPEIIRAYARNEVLVGARYTARGACMELHQIPVGIHDRMLGRQLVAPHGREA